MSSRKRSRTSMEGAYKATGQNRMRARMARARQTYPYAKYGTLFVERGSAEAQAIGLTPGKKYRETSDAEKAIRKRYGWVGRGAYSLKDVGGGVGRSIGGVFGNRTLGYALGRAAGSAASMFMGRGAYTANQLVSGASMNNALSGGIRGDETGDMVLSHREYISDVYGPSSTAFENTTYIINPGMQQTFPWLSQIASNFEEYELVKCVFMYRSTVSESTSNTSGQAGSLILATNYNASQAPFSDKEIMMQYHGACSGKVTETIVHGVECDPAKVADNVKFVRTAPVPYGEDQKTYDHGQFQIAIQNLPTAFQNQALGELWVEYTVRLSKPKFFTNRGLGIQRDIFLNTAPADASNFFPSDSATVYRGLKNSIGCVVISGTNGSTGRAVLRLQFPETFSGWVSVSINAESANSTQPVQSGTGPWMESSIGATARIAYVYDQYAAGANASDAPQAQIAAAQLISTRSSLMYSGHFQVLPPLGGGLNEIQFDSFITGTSLLGGVSMEVTEINPGFATSNTDNRPQWVNTAGVISVV